MPYLALLTLDLSNVYNSYTSENKTHYLIKNVYNKLRNFKFHQTLTWNEKMKVCFWLIKWDIPFTHVISKDDWGAYLPYYGMSYSFVYLKSFIEI